MKKLIALLALVSVFALTACDVSINTGDTDSDSTTYDYAEDEVEVWLDDTAPGVVGEAFDVYATIDNVTDEYHTIYSIDVGTNYLDSMTFNGSTPEYIEEWDMSVIGIYSYDYGIELAPGETQEIVMSFTPSEAGYIAGTFDVCIDTEDDCFGGLVETDVTE